MGHTEIRVARDAHDREAVGRLRFDVYCRRRGWLDPAEFPDGIETDAYDERSLHLLALEAGEAVGTVRLVRHGAGGFPIEAAFERPRLADLGLDAWDTRIAEVSRLVVLRSASPHTVFAALLQCLYRQSLALGVTVWLTATDAKARRLANERIGVESTQYADAQHYCGSLTVPGALVLERMMVRFAEQRPAMHAFFAADWPPGEVVARAAVALESSDAPVAQLDRASPS